MRTTLKRIVLLGAIMGLLMVTVAFSYSDTVGGKQTMASNTDVEEEKSAFENITNESSTNEDAKNKINEYENSIVESTADIGTISQKTEDDNTIDKNAIKQTTTENDKKTESDNSKSINNSDNDDSTKAETEDENSDLIIAQVDDYVNIRGSADINGEIIGKLYNNSVGTLLEKEGEWLKIESGSVTGYVKSEFVLTGSKAVSKAEKVGQRMAEVTTTTLKVREEPSLDAIVLSLVPEGDILTVSKEVDGWVKVSVEEGEGYVSADYVKVFTKNVLAESKADEEERLKKEEEERIQANAAAENRNSTSSEKTVKTNNSGLGNQIAEYAVKFVGNPYVYGGISLTNGADCSGFVMSVYENFGITLPRTSGEQGQKGSRVNGIENAVAGDIVWYSGHIGIYIGGGKLVHASNSKPYPQGGIKISDVNYRPILSIRRIV
ncbi:MAG: SH3 domain-containing protein [Mobilitalea sp.]